MLLILVFLLTVPHIIYASCSNKEFQCLNGRCIPEKWQCDVADDCGDNSDELDCPKTSCTADEFDCGDGICIPSAWKCDGTPDCQTKTDEECTFTTKSCNEEEFQCSIGQCILKRWLCDGDRDCMDGSDESSEFCNTTLITTPITTTMTTQTKDIVTTHKTENRNLTAGEKPILILATRNGITKIETDNWYMQPLVQGLNTAVSVDYDYKRKMLFWSDVAKEAIYKAPIHSNGTVGQSQRILHDIKTPDGIAVDWIYGNIYWTDTGYDRVEVSRQDGSMRKTLIDSDLDEPRAIAVDPNEGWLFYSDWGLNPKIERISMDGDGTTREKIVKENIVWPNGLTLDYLEKRVYWTDAKSAMISSVRYDGKDRRLVYENQNYLKHSFAVAIFEHRIYFTDWTYNSITSVDKVTGKLYHKQIARDTPMDIRVYKELVENPDQNQCSTKEKVCSHLCLPRSTSNTQGHNVSCICPNTFVLKSDGHTCRPDGRIPITTTPDTTTISTPSEIDTPKKPVTTSMSIPSKIYTSKKPVTTNIWTPSKIDTSTKQGTTIISTPSIIVSSRRPVTTTVSTPSKIDTLKHQVTTTMSAPSKFDKSKEPVTTTILIQSKIDTSQKPVTTTISTPSLIDMSKKTVTKTILKSGKLDTSKKLVTKTTKTPSKIYPSKKPVTRTISTTSTQDTINNKRYMKEAITTEKTVTRNILAKTSCTADEFDCGDRRCIPLVWRCDGIPDCLTKTDEECNTATITTRSSPITKTITTQTMDIVTTHKTDNRNVTAGEKPVLIFTTRNRITKIETENWYMQPLVQGLYNAISVDYDYKQRMVFWSDVAKEAIYKAPIHDNGTTGQSQEILHDIKTSDGIAVDWIYGNIYWTDTGYDRVEVSRQDGSMRKTLIDSDLDEPRAIAVDPNEGWLFYSDWGLNPKIERISMDGDETTREKIVKENIVWPNGLTLDYLEKRVYWTDAKSATISSVRYDGTDRRLVYQNQNYLKHPFAVAIFEHRIYFTDWIYKSVTSVDKITGKLYHKHNVRDTPMGIRVYKELVQTPGQNQCSAKENVCSHLCLPRPTPNTQGGKVSCICPNTFVLKSNGHTCRPNGGIPISTTPDTTTISTPSEIDTPNKPVTTSMPIPSKIYTSKKPVTTTISTSSKIDMSKTTVTTTISTPSKQNTMNNKQHIKEAFTTEQPGTRNSSGESPWLIYAYRTGIWKIETDSWKIYPLISGLQNAISIDYDYSNNRIFWTDVTKDAIHTAPFYHNGTIGQTQEILRDIKTPEGIAVDWIYGNIYWTDTGYNTVEVSRQDGTNRKTLIDSDLREPRAISVDPNQGWLFYSDWGSTPKIERLSMDGNLSSREKIVTQEIGWPNGLNLDYIDRRVYWVDAKLDMISSVRYDGTARRVVLQKTNYISHPFGVAVFMDRVYYTDWRNHSITAVDKMTGLLHKKLQVALSPMGIKVYHKNVQTPGKNLCITNSTACSHLCLPHPTHNYNKGNLVSCACPNTHVLNPDGQTCTIRETFRN